MIIENYVSTIKKLGKRELLKNEVHKGREIYLKKKVDKRKQQRDSE